MVLWQKEQLGMWTLQLHPSTRQIACLGLPWKQHPGRGYSNPCTSLVGWQSVSDGSPRAWLWQWWQQLRETLQIKGFTSQRTGKWIQFRFTLRSVCYQTHRHFLHLASRQFGQSAAQSHTALEMHCKITVITKSPNHQPSPLLSRHCDKSAGHQKPMKIIFLPLLDGVVKLQGWLPSSRTGWRTRNHTERSCHCLAIHGITATPFSQ